MSFVSRMRFADGGGVADADTEVKSELTHAVSTYISK